MSNEEPDVLAEFYFMRHAESLANKNRVANGSGSDSKLSDNGEKQTQLVAAFLEGVQPGISEIYHTEMHRAFQSAAGVNTTLGAPLIRSDAFNEQRLGKWEGAPWDQAAIHFLSGEDPPDGEPYASFHDRIIEGLKEIAGKKSAEGKIPLVVSHGGVWLAMNKICGRTDEPWPENCDVFKVRLTRSWENPQMEAERIFHLPNQENISTLSA